MSLYVCAAVYFFDAIHCKTGKRAKQSEPVVVIYQVITRNPIESDSAVFLDWIAAESVYEKSFSL